MTGAIDQNEAAERLIVAIWLEGQGGSGCEVAEADLVGVQDRGGLVLEVFDVDPVLERGHLCVDERGAESHDIGAVWDEGVVSHVRQVWPGNHKFQLSPEETAYIESRYARSFQAFDYAQG